MPDTTIEYDMPVEVTVRGVWVDKPDLRDPRTVGVIEVEDYGYLRRVYPWETVTPVITPAQNAVALGLTARELAILRLFSEGLSMDDVAEQLFLSVNTIKSHAKNLTRKLGAKSRMHLIALGYQHGVLEVSRG